MKRKMAYVITCLLVSGLCFHTTFKANASKKESISQTDISVNNKYEILENNHGIEKNTLVYSFPVNKENAAGYEPANDHEEIGPDAFFISGDTIFIDDTANHQIVVYDKGVYRKSIPLPANMNVMLMFYDASNDILKMVYEELWREDGTDLYLYLTSVCVSEDTEPEPGDKICKNNEMPLQYCFDMDGNLLTKYFQDSSELLYVDEMSVYRDVLTLGQGISYEACTTYTSMPKGGVVTEYILKNDPDDTETYAVPENHEDALTRGNIQVSQEGSIYQMVVDLDSIRIYKLCEKTDGLAEENKLVRIVGNTDTKMSDALAENSAIISDQAFEKQDTPCITIDNQGIKDKKNWNLFVLNSQNKKVTDMRIKYQYDKILYENSSDGTEQYEAYLHFDGENYCYSRGGLDEKYTYLLELTGRSNNAVRNATVVILSDELYSFEQVEKDMYSSNSADHIPYRLLFFY